MVPINGSLPRPGGKFGGRLVDIHNNTNRVSKRKTVSQSMSGFILLFCLYTIRNLADKTVHKYLANIFRRMDPLSVRYCRVLEIILAELMAHWYITGVSKVYPWYFLHQNNLGQGE